MNTQTFTLKARGTFVRTRLYVVDTTTREKYMYEEWHRVDDIIAAYASGYDILARTADTRADAAVLARYATPEEAEAALPIALDILSGKQPGEVETEPTAIPNAPSTESAATLGPEPANVPPPTKKEDIFDELGLIDPFKAFDLRTATDELKNDFDAATAPVAPGAKQWLNKQ